MKTLDQTIKKYKSNCLDGRDLCRLADFVPYDRLHKIGIKLKDDIKKEDWDAKVKPFTRENILEQLKKDVDFGFEKALDRRCISADLMYEVVQMWNWILEEGLEDFDDYRYYGLPLFKATAEKYGFDNPIGDDTGKEEKYDD